MHSEIALFWQMSTQRFCAFAGCGKCDKVKVLGTRGKHTLTDRVLETFRDQSFEFLKENNCGYVCRSHDIEQRKVQSRCIN